MAVPCASAVKTTSPFLMCDSISCTPLPLVESLATGHEPRETRHLLPGTPGTDCHAEPRPLLRGKIRRHVLVAGEGVSKGSAGEADTDCCCGAIYAREACGRQFKNC